MSKKRPAAKLLPALLFSALAGLSSQANAVQFSGVFVFGDSLSDAGYFRPFLTGIGVPAATVAQLGRFTTNPGPVWSELVSQYYGYTPRPSNDSAGNIFAQGGARVASDSASTPPGAAQRSVSTQITEYLARGGGADGRALYAVWAGANDIFQTLPAISAGTVNATTFLGGLAASEIQQIGRLRAAGARYIMVFGLPDIGSTPAFTAGGAAQVAAGTQLSAGFNTNLFTGLQSAGISVIPIDTFSLLNEIRANAAQYGFTNTTGLACTAFPPFTTAATVSSQFCGPGNLAASNAATSYLFADGVHPTTGAHRIVADYAISLIEGPQQLSLLAEAPLRSRESHIRTLDTGLLAASAQPTGKLNVFAAGDGATFELDAGRSNPRYDSEQKSVTVGLTMRASEAVTVGVGIGKSENEASFGNGLGGFDTDETTISAFGSVKMGGFYMNATMSVADVDYENIRRNIAIGQVIRNARASAGGSNASGSLALGYDWTFGKLTIGPFAGVTSQNVSVNGFSEDGAGTANLKIGEQKRISRVIGGGIRASFDLGNFTPFVRISTEREDQNRERDIVATPVHLASGNTYTMPSYVGDSTWNTATLGVRGRLGERVGLSLVYTTVNGREQAKQDGVAASVSFQF